jgi:predicted  nucleic acid-binding Zn-ribbon protein
MHNRYSLLYNELIIRQQQPQGNEIYNEQQRRSEERVRSELLQTQNQAGYLRAKTQDVKNRIDELKRKLTSLRDDGVSAQAKMTREIQEAQRRLELANRDFDEVTSLKTTLEKEISTYRDLLESNEKNFFLNNSFIK